MKSIYPKYSNDESIVKIVMRVKSEIDTIREVKGLDDSHDLSLASNHLDSFLDAIESQYKTKKQSEK